MQLVSCIQIHPLSDEQAFFASYRLAYLFSVISHLNPLIFVYLTKTIKIRFVEIEKYYCLNKQISLQFLWSHINIFKNIHKSWQVPVELSIAQLPSHHLFGLMPSIFGQRLHLGDIISLPQVMTSVEISLIMVLLRLR